ECGVSRIAIAKCLETEPDQTLRFRLQTRVEGGLDDEAVAAGEVRAQARELRARERNELVRDRWRRCRKDVDALSGGRARLRPGDPAVFDHSREHVRLPRACGGVDQRVVLGGTLRKSREICRVREIEV